MTKTKNNPEHDFMIKIGDKTYPVDDSRKDIEHVTHVIANNTEAANLLKELGIDIRTFVDTVFGRYGTVHVLLKPTTQENDKTYLDVSLIKMKWSLMVLAKELTKCDNQNAPQKCVTTTTNF